MSTEFVQVNRASVLLRRIIVLLSRTDAQELRPRNTRQKHFIGLERFLHATFFIAACGPYMIQGYERYFN